METPTLISMVRWSDTKAHSETLLFSDSKSLIFCFFPDRHLRRSGLNSSELYPPPPPPFSLWKTPPFSALDGPAEFCESAPLQRDDIQKWNQRREKLPFLTQHYSSCCRWNKKHDFLFTLNHFIWENHIISGLKSPYFNWVWPPGYQEMCSVCHRLCQDLNFAFQHQSESAAYQPVLVVWI